MPVNVGVRFGFIRGWLALSRAGAKKARKQRQDHKNGAKTANRIQKITSFVLCFDAALTFQPVGRGNALVADDTLSQDVVQTPKFSEIA